MKKLVVALVALVILLLLVWRSREAERPELVASAPQEGLARDATEAPLELETPRAVVEATPANAAGSTVRTIARVRLVDGRTREPAAHFEARVEREADSWEPVATNSEGWLEVELSAERRARGNVRILLAENEAGQDLIQTRSGASQEFPRFVEFDGAAAAEAPVELAIPLGPTYPLSLSLPPGVEAESLMPVLKSANPKQAFDSAHSTVRWTPQPWVRFRPTASGIAGAPPYALSLSTRDGLWFGSAEVPTIVGIHPEPVRIELEARARVTGVLRDDSGRVLAGEWARLDAPGASFTSSTNRPRRVPTDEGGRFSFNAVRAGSYTLGAEVDGHAPTTLEVTLVAGEVTERELVLRKLAEPEIVRLTCTAESGTGTYDGPLYIRALPTEGKPVGHHVRIEWSEEDGRRTGRGSVELPARAFQLEAQATGLIEVEPRELVWNPGDAPPHFRVRDDAPHGSATFEALDPATGERIRSIAVWIDLVDAERTASCNVFVDDGIGRLDWAPLGRSVRFRIQSEGRQTAWGEVVPTLDGVHVVRELAPGWSIEVLVHAADLSPLAGVRLLFDDTLVGVTDPTGVLRASFPRTPTSIRAELDGWRTRTSSTYDADTGRFRDGIPWMRLTLEPVK